MITKWWTVYLWDVIRPHLPKQCAMVIFLLCHNKTVRGNECVFALSDNMKTMRAAKLLQQPGSGPMLAAAAA